MRRDGRIIRRPGRSSEGGVHLSATQSGTTAYLYHGMLWSASEVRGPMRQCFEEKGWLEMTGDPLQGEMPEVVPQMDVQVEALQGEEALLLEVMDKISQLQQELRTMQQENRDFLSRVIDRMAELIKS